MGRERRQTDRDGSVLSQGCLQGTALSGAPVCHLARQWVRFSFPSLGGERLEGRGSGQRLGAGEVRSHWLGACQALEEALLTRTDSFNPHHSPMRQALPDPHCAGEESEVQRVEESHTVTQPVSAPLSPISAQ